jgi:uncharacterized protein
MKQIFIILFLMLFSTLAYATSETLDQLIKKANTGDVSAQFRLGEMYDNGEGIPQDYKEAAKWYRMAAEQEHTSIRQEIQNSIVLYHAKAQYRLGLMYLSGKGVLKNYDELYKWIRMSAENGYASAQSRLGTMYYFGSASQGNYKEAFKWCRMAAEQGDTEAQYYLGVMYYDGKGIIVDYVEAYRWILLAGKNGKNVDRLKSLLQNQMTTAQITEAQRLAKNFVARGGEQKNKGTLIN